MEVSPPGKLVRSGITTSGAFEEFEACIAAGLSIAAWEAGDIPKPLKVRVIAWNRLRQQINLHMESERQRAAEQEAKRRRRGRR
jgi:hypothetical protein